MQHFGSFCDSRLLISVQKITYITCIHVILFICSSRPQEGHDPGPSDNQSDTPDLAIVKIEKVGEDETGGLLLQVDSGQGDAASHMQRLGQFSVEEEQEYDESDLTGDWSQEDMSNEGSSHMEDPTGGGAMYMGPTSGRCLF